MCSSEGRKALSCRAEQKMSAANQEDTPPQRLHRCYRGAGNEAGAGSGRQAAQRCVSVRQEYTPYTHLLKLRGNLGSPIHQSRFREVGGNQRPRRKPTWTRREHVRVQDRTGKPGAVRQQRFQLLCNSTQTAVIIKINAILI